MIGRLKRHGLWLKLALALLAVFLMFRWFEHAQVYHPSRSQAATGAELGRPFEDVFFKAGDGVELNAWFYPGNADAARSRPVVLVCHGNAGNISHRLELCRTLLETGVSVFMLDYRGYGRSKGRPGEEGTYRDAEAAYDWLRQKGFEPGSIVALGESLGGGVASELALRRRIGGLILQSTFTSIPDIGAEYFPWLPVRLVGSIRYDTLHKLPSITAPVLVMHSRADEIIPFRHGERNFAAAGQPKQFCEIRGGHNDPLIVDAAVFKTGIEQFLNLLAVGGRN